MSQTKKDGLKLESPKITYEQTLRRLQKIQKHLERPRGDRLKGKVCIITGVGSLKGIGRSTALLFAHEGAKALYLLDFDGTNLPDLKNAINKTYPDVHVVTVQGDAADDATVSQLVSNAVKEQGQLDIFFANAGIASGTPSMLHLEDEEWEKMMHVNTTSCFLAVKYAAPAMMKINEGGSEEEGRQRSAKDASNGSIILTASVAGLRSGAGPVHYSASKAAVNSIAQSASWNLRHSNIRVNSICPGLIETGMTATMFEMARQRGTAQKIGQLNPLGRYGVAEGKEVVWVCGFCLYRLLGRPVTGDSSWAKERRGWRNFLLLGYAFVRKLDKELTMLPPFSPGALSLFRTNCLEMGTLLNYNKRLALSRGRQCRSLPGIG